MLQPTRILILSRPAAALVTARSWVAASQRFIAMMLVAALAAGCQQTMLTVSDAFCTPDQKSALEARLERTARGGMAGIAGVPITFYFHDQRLGEAVTDDMGVARLTCELPADSTHFRAEARHAGDPLKGEGLVFRFPPGRMVIVCDIDGTVSMTHYRELVFDEHDMASRPFDDAAAVLTKLNERFGLVYLTARPGFLLEKSKRWLEANGFPRAPVITTPGLAQSIGVQKFKAERIAHLKRVLGRVGIGIGNAETDSEAYAMQHLLTIILDNDDDNRFRSHAVVLRDWKMIEAFFDANREVLEDYDRLQAAIDGEAFIRRPILHYRVKH